MCIACSQKSIYQGLRASILIWGFRARDPSAGEREVPRDLQEILDKTPMAAVNVIAVAVCVVLNALDGFDVLSISFAAPGIATEWGVDRAALGVVLAMELIGMGLGALFLGGVADRIGRRPTILLCLAVMSPGMLGAGFANGVIDLLIYRLITGIGIGGMLASTNAMAAEYSNARHRNLAVTLMAGGYPLGVILGGTVAAELLVRFDWRAIFYFGAGVTASFLVAVWYLLPESVSFLAKKQPVDALRRINSILSRMRQAPLERLAEAKQPTHKTSMAALFSSKLRFITVVLTVAYFSQIMTHYFFLKWVPKLVTDMGYIPSTAGTVLVWANVGGVVSSILMGLLSHRFSMRALTMAVMGGCAVMIVVFGGGASSLGELSFVAAMAGFFTQASVVGLYCLFAQSFPTEVRAGGTGFAIGIGRGGAALGPIVAGLLFSLGYGLQFVAVVMAGGSAAALVALFFLKPTERIFAPASAVAAREHGAQ
jgi:MFS transporter, AAHS family, vanillate permease